MGTQRGLTCPDGSACDIGAYEFQGQGALSVIVKYSDSRRLLPLAPDCQIRHTSSMMPPRTMNAIDLAPLAAYDLTPPVTAFPLADPGTRNATVGLHTGAGEFIWKIYQAGSDLDVLRGEHRLLAWLATQPLSFSAPAPVSLREGGTICATPNGYGVLFPHLTGRRPNTAKPEHIAAVGAGLGELHVTLTRCPVAPSSRLAGYADLRKVHPHLTDPFALTSGLFGLPATADNDGLFAWWRQELAVLQQWIERFYNALPRQMVHGDFGPGNTLYEAGRLSAIIDFELALLDARAIDVAAGLFFSVRPWENRDPLVLLDAFGYGYARWVSLSEAEIQALAWLMRLRNVVSVIWRMGRALAAGLPAPLERMVDTQTSNHWIATHEVEILDRLANSLYHSQNRHDQA